MCGRTQAITRNYPYWISKYLNCNLSKYPGRLKDIFFVKKYLTTNDRMVVGFITTYMQSVPITTNVVSSNPTQAKCTRYNIM